jgi:predicted acylesterase/phospholipase RssA
MKWGNKDLIDGGIMNIVPGNVAKQAGMDVVIGIDMRATRFVFSKWQITLKRILNLLKRVVWPNQAEQLWQRVSSLLDYADFFNAYPNVTELESRSRYPNLFSVLGRSLDLAIEAQHRQKADSDFQCDMLIVPETPTVPFWKKFLFLHFTDFSNTQEYYKAGRRTAYRNMPKLWKLLAEVEAKEKEKTGIIKNLISE